MKIVAAAIHYKGLTFTIAAPARHGDIYKLLFFHDMAESIDGTEVPGFITDTGVFVNRRDAMTLAKNANQLREATLRNNSKELYSEDLW